MGDTNDGRAVGHATGCGRSGIGPKPQRAGIPDATTDSSVSNKHGPAACISSPACGESGPEIAPARADRSSADGGSGYAFRSGDASVESGARTGESRQITPGPDHYPAPCRGGQGHADEDLEDMGAALLWPTVLVIFLIALAVSAWALGG